MRLVGKLGLTPNQLWLALFGLWIMFLTGILTPIVSSPGMIQSFRLSSLLETKNRQIMDLQSEIAKLEAESVQLEKNRAAQQREIRRVLGYAAEDEIIFDFTTSKSL